MARGGTRIGRLTLVGALAAVAWGAVPGAAPVAHAAPPTATLTLDIETAGEGSNPLRLTRNGTKVFFAADDGVHGVELWMVDGAAAPVMVSDINPGAAGSNPRNLAVVSGTLWFNADDGAHGSEPWKSDGTAPGTAMVADVYPGITSSNPDEFVALDGEVYFAAQDASFGREVWRSNGTAIGTLMTWNLRTGTSSSSPTDLTVIDYGGSVGQRLWLVAEASGGTASAQRELVTVDGQAGGVDPLTVAITDRAARELTVLGTSLYLVAEPTSTSSGFDATTLHRVQLNAAGPPATFTATSLGGTNPFNLTAVGSELYFTATGASEGSELFHLSGGVPSLLADIRPGAIGSDPSDLTPANATSMYFVADDGTRGRELWRATNGVGVTLVADLAPGEDAAVPGELRAAAGAVVFAASTASGREPWYFSGTGAPVLMEDINPGAGNSTPRDFVAVIGVGIFFAADDPVAGNELTKVPLPFDVNATNRASAYDLRSGTADSVPGAPGKVGPYVAWDARTDALGDEPYVLDTRTGVTSLLADISPGPAGSSPTGFAPVGAGTSSIFFADDGVSGSELWRTDGTPAGTAFVEDISPGPISSFAEDSMSWNGLAYFPASTTTEGEELWRSDGTAAGTFLLADVTPGNSGFAGIPVGMGASVYFETAGPAGDELWRSDGTTVGTARVDPTDNPVDVDAVVATASRLFFVAADTTLTEQVLWTSDGTAAGTVQVQSLGGAHAINFSTLVTSGDAVYFFAENSVTGDFGLWRSDGTAGGTVELVSSQSFFTSTDIAPIPGGGVLFAGGEPATGTELWRSLGTPATTALVTDIVPGTDDGALRDLVPMNGWVYFGASTPTEGRELWRSDGVTTERLTDLSPGTSDGADLLIARAVNDRLFFEGFTQAEGSELWYVTDVPPVPAAPATPTASAVVGGATVTWTAVGSPAGAPVTAYTATAAPGGATCATTGALSCTVSGLTVGTPYTFTVTATNRIGTSPPSPPSAAVVPLAPAIPAPPIVTLSPRRILETRTGPGLATVDGQFQGQGRRAAGSVLELDVAGRAGVPAGASAAVLNVTAVFPGGAGYLTVFPCGENQPNASSVNYQSGQVVPNAVVAKIGTGGKVCIFTLAATDLLVDVNGYVMPGGAPATVSPARLLETRSGAGLTTVDGQFQGQGRRAAGSVLELTVAGRAGVPADASAAVLNVTAVFPGGAGYLTVFPCGENQPNASSVNYQAGQVVPNAVLAKIGAGGKVCIFTLAATDLLVDVNGFVPAGSPLATLTPARLLETRSGANLETVDGQFQGQGRRAAGSVVELTVVGRGGVPAGATAVMLNVTAVFPDGPGYLTVFPCGEDQPNASSVNYQSGQVVPNAVLAKVGAGGKVCIFTLASTDLVVDVTAAA